MANHKSADLQGALTREVNLNPKPERQVAAGERPTQTPGVEIEIKQVVVVRKIDSLVEAWCEKCETQAQWIAPEAAAVILNADTRTIYRRIEANAVHFTETTEGVPLVCLSSLFD